MQPNGKVIKTALIISLLTILAGYIRWGIVESFRHYPSFDEAGVLAIASNFARYGKYETVFSYHDAPRVFNPFTSTGPTIILPLSLLFKIFGYHYYLSNLFIFFTINLPLIGIALLLFWRIIGKKPIVEKMFLSLLLLLLFLTNRLFYASPPTGGSFTHGALGEPCALLLIFTSSLLLLKGIESNKLLIVFLSGLFSALALSTKTIATFHFLALTLTIGIVALVSLKRKQKNRMFFLKAIFLIITALIAVKLPLSLWKNYSLRGQDQQNYSCWRKVAFLTHGSGINTLLSMDPKRIMQKPKQSLEEIINFFTVKMEPKWKIENKKKIIYLAIGYVLTAIISFINFIKTLSFALIKKKTKVDGQLIVKATLVVTFLLGTIWFFLLADFSWIRFYYIFFFVGIITVISLAPSLPKILYLIFTSLVFAHSLVAIWQSPFAITNLTIPEDKIDIEKTDNAFIDFYSARENKKTYVCGYFNLWEITFLTGVNFYNNILIDDRDIFPECNFLPRPKIRDITEKDFYYIMVSTMNPECEQFLEDNKNRLKLIYDQGYRVFTTTSSP